MKRDALSRKQTLEQIRKLEIESDSNTREKFEHGHFRTEPVPNGTQFEADRARADDKKLLWGFGERKCFGAADDRFAIELRKRQFHRAAPSSDHNVFCFELLRIAVR